MKKLVYLAFICFLLLTDCDIENNASQNFFLEVVPIESVEVPDYFVYGETYEMQVNYTKPNDCYFFNDFIYEIENDSRVIAVVNTVYTDIACNQTAEEVTVNFDFTVQCTDTHVFMFYQGEDNNGVDQYLIVEIPVLE